MKVEPTVVSKFSLLFIRKFRVTIIVFLAILALGFLSYDRFLKREGFPPIEVPLVSIQSTYFVDDAEKVDQEITMPMVKLLQGGDSVKTINSLSNNNFSFVTIELEAGTDSELAKNDFEEKIGQNLELPEQADLNFVVFDAGSIDGENNMVIYVSGEKDVKQLQDKATEIAAVLENNKVVEGVVVKELITSETNPITGEEFDFQNEFNRVGVVNDGELSFRPAVAIGIKSNEDFGTIEVSDAIREEIDQIKQDEQFENIEISYGQDLAVSLKDQVVSLESNALYGFYAVILILLLFVNWRASLVTAIFIPTVLAATFLALFIGGYTLNVISLFSLILVLGLFVDDAIVVVEAIDYQKKHGKKGIEAVKQAINEIGTADILGSLTTILVFAPILFASGVLGDFISLIPITVIIALTCSVIIALSIIPLFTNAAIPDEGKKLNVVTRGLDRLFGVINNAVLVLAGYVSRAVEYYLSRKFTTVLVIVLSLGLIGIGMYFAGTLKFNIFPAPKDTNEITLSMDFEAEDLEISEAEDLAIKVEDVLKQEIGEYIEEVVYNSGNATSASANVLLTDYSQRDTTSTEMVENLQMKYEDLDGVEVKVSKVSVGPPTTEYPFAVQIKGENLQDLENTANEIKEFVNKQELADDAKVEDVVINYKDVVARIDGERYVELRAKFNTDGNALPIELQGLVEEEFDEARLEALNLAADSLGFDFGQDSENLDSFQSLGVAGIVAIILIYVLLVWQFDSFLQPLLILFAIPLSFVGLFPGLSMMDIDFSFFVLIGIIGLAGIVVNNTIMLVDFANQARSRGESVNDSITHAINVRFRPLVTTSVTTLAGLLPLALTDPFWEPLAYTIIFGLLSSTILVILAFPAYYSVLERFAGKITKPFSKS